MASPYQGIPTLPGSLPIAKTCTHPESHTYALPRIQVALGEANHVQPSAPATPDQRLRRPNRILGSHNTESPPGGGIALSQSAAQSAAIPDDLPSRPTTLQPASPSRTANIRLRRSQHGSTLLQSPARAGHAARMRQIFEDASRGYPNAEIALYPQLPNISRKASPLRFHDRSVEQETPCVSSDCPPASSSLSLDDLLVVPRPAQLHPNLSGLSERTSGSWSDDSGYFIADSRGRTSAFTASPKERIYDWLLNVSRVGPNTPEDTVADNGDDEPAHCPLTKTSKDAQELTVAESDDEGAEMLAQTLDLPLECHQQIGYRQTENLDPFIIDEHESSTCPAFGSNLGQEPFSLPSYRSIPPGYVSSVCKRLNSSQSGPFFDRSVEKPTTTIMPPISPLHDKDITRSTPLERQTPNEGGIELSPLSPNVCIDRGPSRYHSNRKQPNLDSTSTPSKMCSSIDEQAAQLKENMAMREESTPGFASPLASRSARAGTRFQRSQYNALTFNINKPI